MEDASLGDPTETVIGKTFSLSLHEAGSYVIELRSHAFDSLLVLRDGKGSTIGQDNDGGIGKHARLLTTLSPGIPYALEACSVGADPGPFELRFAAAASGVPGSDVGVVSPLEDAERGVRWSEENEGGDTLPTAFALLTLGDRLWEAGEFERARTCLERSLKIRKALLGPDHPKTGIVHNSLGGACMALGDFGTARSHLEKDLEISRRTYGPNHLATVMSENNLGELLRRLGFHQDALPLLRRTAEAFSRELGDRPETAACLNNYSLTLHELGYLEESKETCRRALSIREEVLGEDHPDTAQSLNNLGSLLRDTGEFPEARACLERALAIREKVFGPDHPRTGVVLSNLGLLFLNHGDPRTGLTYAQSALNAYEQAFGDHHPGTAVARNNVALISLELSREEEALELFLHSLENASTAFGPHSRQVAHVLTNLSLAHQRLGDSAQAIDCSLRAEEICRTSLPAGHPMTATVLLNLAGALDSGGDPGAALDLYREALSIREDVLGHGHPRTAHCAAQLAQALLEAGKAAEAWGLLVPSAGLWTDHRLGVLSSLTEAERHRYAANERWKLETLLTAAHALEKVDAQKRSYEAVLAWKGQIMRLLTSSYAQIRTRLAPDVQGVLDRLRDAQGRLSAMSRGEADGDLVDLVARREELELQLLRVLPETRLPPPPSFDQLSTGLPANSAFVDFLIHQEFGRDESGNDWNSPQISVWITKPGATAPLHLNLGDAAPIIEAIEEYRSAIAWEHSPARGVSVPRDGQELTRSHLYELLWEPVEALLGDTNLLIISPDGALCALPFGAIPLDDGSYLLERYEIVQVRDADLPRGAARPAFPSDLLCVGAVAYHRGNEEAASASPSSVLHPRPWPYLPWTDTEARSLGALHERRFGGVSKRTLLTGSDASEARVRTELTRHSVVHLATHGFFDPSWLSSRWEEGLSVRKGPELLPVETTLEGMPPGMMSGLVLAGAADPSLSGDDDGYLTAEELDWLDLSQVDLVVLSACQTGLGHPRSGEGLIGLQRSFLTAGARTVISSLWSVPDESTTLLMETFYSNLWVERLSCLEALRNAQLSILKENRAEHGNSLPSTWGAFVLSGDWR